MDTLGLLTLAEMREVVWRNVRGLTPGAVDADGNESGGVTIDPLFSVQTLNRYIQTSVTANAAVIAQQSDTVMSDDTIIDVVQDVTEYVLPPDMISLQGLFWKPAGVAYSTLPVNQRTQMDCVGPNGPCWQNGAPTYRLHMQYVVLTEAPKQDNLGGIQVQYKKWLLQLTQDDDKLETQFARLLQEVVILDATIKAASRQSGLDTSEFRADLTEAKALFQQAVREAFSPPEMRMMNGMNPFEGIRGGSVRTLWT